jgi:hypothetical protein
LLPLPGERAPESCAGTARPFPVRPGPSYTEKRMRGYPFLSHVSSFAGRAVVFFFIVSMLCLFLYILGNSQDFLDATQLFLLACLRISLSLEIITSVWLAGFLISRSIREHRPFVVRWILLAASFSVSAVLLAALRLLQQWLHS